MSKDDLAHFCRHADKSAHPHPEYGAWAAYRDGAGDSGYVAVADGASESRGKSAEGRDVVAALFFYRIFFTEESSDRVAHNIPKTAKLEETKADGKIEPQHKEHHGKILIP